MDLAFACIGNWLNFPLLRRFTGDLFSFRHCWLLVVWCLLSKCLISDARDYFSRLNFREPSRLEEENTVVTVSPEYDPNTSVNVTTEKGQVAFLHCRVKNAGGHTVSWARYTKELVILTIGDMVFTRDSRFMLVRVPGSADWTLRIQNVRQNDAGVYECQVGTTPKMGRNMTLSVMEALQADSGDSRPRVRTADNEVARAIIKGDRETNVGLNLNLTCYIASSLNAPSSNLIKWYHNDTYLNYDPTARSGHQTEIYQGPNAMTSRLHIAFAHPHHAGKYTCSSNNAEPSTIFVRVHPSQQPLALGRSHPGGGAMSSACSSNILTICIFLWILSWFGRPMA